MKKKYGISLIIIILVIAAIVGYFVYQKVEEDKKTYEVEKVTEYNFFVLREKEKYGVIDKQGKVVIEATYKNIIIPNPQKSIFIAYNDQGQTSVINEKNETILTNYQQIEPIRLKNISSDLMYEKSVATYQKDQKVGLITLEGKKLTEPIYEEISALPYKEGELLVKKDQKYGVMNMKGAIVIEPEYSKITVDNYYTEKEGHKNAGYIIEETTKEGYRYGYINSNKQKIIEPKYNELSRVTDIEEKENVYLIAAQNGQYGILKNDKLILENKYQSIRYDKTNQVFIIEKSKKYGVINTEGKSIIPVEYAQIDITGKYIYAKTNQEVSVYTKEGKSANIPSNTEILETSNAKYKIKIVTDEKTQYGILDENDNILVETKYAYIEYLYDKYFIASEQNGKLGIIDEKGNQIIPLQYDSIQKIADTQMIQVYDNQTKTTIIYNKEIKEVCQMENATIEILEEAIKIYNQEDTRYFDKQGEKIENTKVYPNNPFYSKKEEGKWGMVDKQGKEQIPYEYDKITDFNSYGFAGIKKDGKWGVVDNKGQIIQEPTYTINTQDEPFFIGQYYRVQYGFGECYYTK